MKVSPGRVGRWTPTEVSSHTPAWDQWRHGWWSQNLDTYNPGHYPQYQRRTSVSEWQRKRYPGQHLRDPQGSNYVIPLATHVSEPNPYTDRAWVARYSREERYRMGQDINWVTLGTKGG